MTRKAPCREADVVAARDAGANDTAKLAAALGFTQRSAVRWAHKVPGIAFGAPTREPTQPEKLAFMRRMFEDEVPDNWIAETLGVSYFIVTDYKAKWGMTKRRSDPKAGSFSGVLQSIRRDPALLALHREFAPK